LNGKEAFEKVVMKETIHELELHRDPVRVDIMPEGYIVPDTCTWRTAPDAGAGECRWHSERAAVRVG